MMMAPDESQTLLTKAVDSARALLGEKYNPKDRDVATDSLQNLLELCKTYSFDANREAHEPIRSIHHFACTGGTLITKHLATTANVQVLSEVDPLSSVGIDLDDTRFAPTDMIRLLRQNIRDVSNDVILNIFIGGLSALYKDCTDHGRRLILRDHAHSHFCTDQDYAARPSLLGILRENFNTLSVVTVRHPLDSYLSLQSNNWVNFKPATLDEYCRRYGAFLLAYKNVPIVRYEDFVTSRHDVYAKLCAILKLPINPDVQDLLPAINLTGDSGRSGNSVAVRPRRLVPDEVGQEIKTSSHYAALCARLGYEGEGVKET